MIRSRVGRTALLAALAACARGTTLATSPAPGRTSAEVDEADLRARLFALAHDTMMGRAPGSEGDFKATAWIAAEFARLGLRPAGDSGGWFQTLPFRTVRVDESSRVAAGGRTLALWSDWLPTNPLANLAAVDGAESIYAGAADDPASWIDAERSRGRVLVFTVRDEANARRANAVFGDRRFSGAAAFAFVRAALPPETMAQLRAGRLQLTAPTGAAAPPVLFVTPSAGDALLGARIAGLTPGATGPAVTARVVIRRDPVPFPARNVVAVLPGSDPALRGQYVSLTAHNDHVGFGHDPVDHDSVRAFNRVVRPMGADSPPRAATPEEAARVRALLDSLRRAHPPRADSIRNGADDDGTGTVALLEIAEALAAAPRRPRRSVLFVSHTAEEYGLLGSQWFTDHATVPVDSIVGELDMDMIGRGSRDDLPEGGAGYLERVGTRRLSTEFGDAIDAVNARQPTPFAFNDTYDQPGHPLQYYCRADHYSYARYGIPAVAFSRGEHLDYHQVTDEPQYIDYAALARVARFVRDVAVELGNRDQRPRLDRPKGDPRAPCRQ